jgi:hypothetical protein
LEEDAMTTQVPDPLVVRPTCDPAGTLTLHLDSERGSLVVDDGGERTRFSLLEGGDEVGWYRRGKPVELREVIAHCLRDWTAEQAVLAMSQAAVERAGSDRGCRLGEQLRLAPKARAISVLPFQRWFVYLTTRRGPERLSPADAAARAGYIDRRRGRADTTRLYRRLGLSTQHKGGRGAAAPSQFVSEKTALALCRALDRDPAELGI